MRAPSHASPIKPALPPARRSPPKNFTSRPVLFFDTHTRALPFTLPTPNRVLTRLCCLRCRCSRLRSTSCASRCCSTCSCSTTAPPPPRRPTSHRSPAALAQARDTPPATTPTLPSSFPCPLPLPAPASARASSRPRWPHTLTRLGHQSCHERPHACALQP
eukprot:2103332-Pleurochrysis_carterae.AAC.1